MTFETELVCAPMPDGRRWYLKQALVWRGDDNTRITVPAGFTTDFASVPRLVWAVISPWGKHGRAAVIHDYEYRLGFGTRREADDLFLQIMEECGQLLVIRYAMWAAVRLFGWIAWHGNAMDRKRGVRAVLANGEMPAADAVAPRRGLDRLIRVICKSFCRGN